MNSSSNNYRSTGNNGFSVGGGGQNKKNLHDVKYILQTIEQIVSNSTNKKQNRPSRWAEILVYLFIALLSGGILFYLNNIDSKVMESIHMIEKMSEKIGVKNV